MLMTPMRSTGKTEAVIACNDLANARALLLESYARNGISQPKTMTAFLPRNHPLSKMSDREFEAIAGPHVTRAVVGKD